MTDFSAVHGGFSHVSLIDNSSLLVLVGGGRVPRFAPNKVILWDEDAIWKVPIQKSPRGDGSSSSESAGSLVASTVFSVGRKETNLSDSQDPVQTRSSPTLSQDLASSALKEDTSEIHFDTPDIPDDDEITTSSNFNEVKTLPFTSSSTSVEVDTLEVELPIQTSFSARKAKSSSSSSSARLPSSSSHIIRKGRAVAELEFGEAVKGICVKTFDVNGSLQADEITGSITMATLLVVILDSKAVVFEMGPHIPSTKQTVKEEGSKIKNDWGVRQRIVVEIRPGLERGLASMAQIPDTSCVLLALPGRQTGHVQLLSIALSNTSRTSIRSSIAGASAIIAAHANSISSITLSDNGRLLCTASERGTLLRVWSTLSHSGLASDKGAKSLSTSLVSELRRGSDAAKIWSVSFSPDSLLLAAGSDKGTIHFFNLRPLHQAIAPLNSIASHQMNPTISAGGSPSRFSKTANKYLPNSIQQFTNSIPPSLIPQYLKSQWSFTQFKVPLKVFSSSIAEGPRTTPFSLHNLAGIQDVDIQGGSVEDNFEKGGKQVSLEGGWAGMRGRIDDVRKGEKGIEEGMWLTWISAKQSEQGIVPLTKESLSLGPKDKSKSQDIKSFELVVITSSGSHYRIGVAMPNQDVQKANEKSKTVLNMYKEGESSEEEKASSGSNHEKEHCWLIEYKRFGMRDDWVD